jgi:hypothetical protein
MSKILITGFSHCGTSILKSIIGHIDDVDEIINETKKISRISQKKFIVCKFLYNLYKNFLLINIIKII